MGNFKRTTMKSAILALGMVTLTTALHVIQWQDNMILSKGHYLDLTNDNAATKISERQPAIEQFFVFNLTSNYQNYAFDVLVFSEEAQEAFECYDQAIRAQKYNTSCDLTNVEQYLNVQSYSDVMQSLDSNDMKNMHIVVDNSPFPDGGAVSHADLTTMLSIRTNFRMNYNIKTLTIYAGLLIISLTFATCGVM